MALALAITACAQTTAESPRPDLPVIDADGLEAHLEGLDRPAVVNVWASWCIPCRSEAPLFTAAEGAYGDRIVFIGIAVEDSQPDAKAFLDEFEMTYDQYFDRERSVPARYGGFGTPITFFFAPGGELVDTHNGVIDERTLALDIDELLRRDG